jgi:hypothetical protein
MKCGYGFWIQVYRSLRNVGQWLWVTLYCVKGVLRAETDDRLRASDAVNNTIFSRTTSNMQIEQILYFLRTENANPELSILRRNALIGSSEDASVDGLCWSCLN